MPYMYNGKALRTGKGFTDADGIQHPANWASAWSKDEISEKGITWVDPAPTFDSRFYWAYDVPKALEDKAEVDEDGNPVLDEKGNQLITLGLKSQAIAQVKTTAGALLSETAWMIERFNDPSSGKEVPLEVLGYRTAVRDASDVIEAAIVACTNLDQFKALYDAPVDAEGNVTGNAPIADWPEA